MASSTFVLKDKNASKETPIFLVFRVGDDRFKISTDEKILPEFWNFKDKRVKETVKFPTHPEFNTRLNQIKETANNVYRRFKNDNGTAPTLAEFKNLLRDELKPSHKVEKLTLFSFIDKHIAESKLRVNVNTGKPIAPSTIRSLKNTNKVLQAFAKHIKRPIDFDTIDLDFYFDFKKYLNEVKVYSANTSGKHINNLKTFLNEATERGLNTNLQFKSRRFIGVREETNNIYLNNEELKKIYNLDLSRNPKLERVRDLFIVGCYTGLRFSDFTRIKKDNIKNNQITIKTQKTGNSVVIPLHTFVKSIMKKYEGQFPNSLPPSISNVKMNKYLKELGKLSKCLNDEVDIYENKGGLKSIQTKRKWELLTTHTARRSFATNLYLEGLSVFNIMAITGHKTEKAFFQYIKITKSESAKVLELHWKKNNNLKIV